MEAAPLGKGDVVRFSDPRRGGGPALRVHLPSALAELREVAPAAPAPPKPRTAPPARIPGLAERIAAAQAGAAPRRRLARLPLVAIGAVLAGAGALATWRLLLSGPIVDSVQPVSAEPGQRVAITGARFAAEAGANTVWFGEASAAAESSTGDTLHLRVPPGASPGTVSLVVETPRGRSGPVPFRVLALLEAQSLDPEGGLPEEEVVLRGLGFAPGTMVSVDGVAAPVVSVEPRAVRFRVPALEAADGARVPLVAVVDGRSTAPIPFVFGRLPRIESIEPPKAAAGEIVRLRGVGFAHDAAANAVTFDGTAAAVVAASRSELAVVVPFLGRPGAESDAALLVSSLGRSSEPRPFTVLRVVDGAFVPRCIVQPAAEAAAGGPLLAGTQLGPLLMLASRDEAESVARRALGACGRLTDAFDRARRGERVTFEARDHPSGGVGVGIVGQADMIERVTAEDAAAYERPPGLPPRREAPPPAAVARLWASVLNEVLSVVVTGDLPADAAVSPALARAFAELRRVLPWRAGEGVSAAAAAAVPAATRRLLREAALAVP